MCKGWRDEKQCKQFDFLKERKSDFLSLTQKKDAVMKTTVSSFTLKLIGIILINKVQGNKYLFPYFNSSMDFSFPWSFIYIPNIVIFLLLISDYIYLFYFFYPSIVRIWVRMTLFDFMDRRLFWHAICFHNSSIANYFLMTPQIVKKY